MLRTIYKVFPQGKHKVLTLSYDDGDKADIRLVKLFNDHGIKGTFHLNAGLLENDDHRIRLNQVKELYKGHEVAAHTLTHPSISRCPLNQVFLQIQQDRELLEEAVGYTVRGMSYPNGSYSRDIRMMLKAAGIEYARVVGNSEGFEMPDDFTQWKATCHHRDRLLAHGERFLEADYSHFLYMMYVWGHSFNFDRENNWTVIEEFCTMTGGREDIWYATNIEIVDYLKAWDMLQFSAAGNFVYNPMAVSLWVEVDGEAVELLPGVKTNI